VDLISAARVATKPPKNNGTLTKFQNGVKTTVLIPPPMNRVRGKSSHTMVRPTWTLAELGQASQGVPQVPFMAACFAYAGDRSNYWKLHGALLDRARLMRDARKWPMEVIDHHSIKRPYLEHLAKLVLDVDACPSMFNACPQLYAIYMGVTERIWERDLQEHLRDLQEVWTGWLHTAARIIQPRLRDGDEYDESL
jgi:hypothetical protein